MLAAITFLVGVMLGCGVGFVLTLESRRRLNSERQNLADSRATLDRQSHEFAAQQSQLNAAMSAQKQELVHQHAKLTEDLKKRQAQIENHVLQRRQELAREEGKLREQEAALKKGFITLTDLQKENALLKRDLQNVDVNLHKLELDRDRDRERQAEIEAKVQEMAGQYLRENVKWIGSSISANNFVSCKQRLLTVIEQCRAIGFEIPQAQEQALVEDLKREFERAVKAQLEREEQSRIKARLREEQQLQKEIDRELQRLERERQVVKAALDKALADAQQQHTQEVEQLEARLAEAESKLQRAVSQAQLTKSGHVYVISNIGSFGENVYKIGMTRRLEPQDRVGELGDASVPFPFDVHMMVYSEDAPKLENALHRALHKTRLNKLKPRKEFYRADLDSIVRVVRENHGDVEYRADPEALEYRQSLVASDEDQEFVEAVWDEYEQKNQSDSTG